MVVAGLLRGNGRYLVMLTRNEVRSMNPEVAQAVVSEYEAVTETTKEADADPNGFVYLLQVTVAQWVAICLGEVKTNARLSEQNLPLQIVFGSLKNMVTRAQFLFVGAYQTYWRTEDTRAEWDDVEAFAANLWQALAPSKVNAFATALVSLCYKVSIDPQTGLDNLKRFTPLKDHVDFLNGAYTALDGTDGLKGHLGDIHLGDYVAKGSEYADMTLLDYIKSNVPTTTRVGSAEPIDHAKQGKSLLASLKKVTKA